MHPREVGPGLGSLTLALLEAAAGSDARLVAVEIDPALAAALLATVAERAPEAAGRFCAMHADALHVVGPGAAHGHADGGTAKGGPAGAVGSLTVVGWVPAVGGTGASGAIAQGGGGGAGEIVPIPPSGTIYINGCGGGAGGCGGTGAPGGGGGGASIAIALVNSSVTLTAVTLVVGQGGVRYPRRARRVAR